ncbi:uncharacterized protein LODBEIA_P30080 [Lodderomyces beijingensis]|uniref:Trafficking protein particle complex subunit 20 n=1 Tax=Lodderomyces beijingensis TaxID=1775926 RepID=A0ABP0ZKV5_9ASCO
MSSYYLAIVGTRENPLYEVEFSSFKSSTSSTISSSSTSVSSSITSQAMPSSNAVSHNVNNSSGSINKEPVHVPGKSQFPPSTKELLPFIASSSLDVIEDQQWSTQLLNLGKIDQFYGISISAYITQGNIKFILCYDSNKEENSIRQFFQDINDLYVKALMNPFYNVNDAMVSPDFDLKVKLIAKKYL